MPRPRAHPSHFPNRAASSEAPFPPSKERSARARRARPSSDSSAGSAPPSIILVEGSYLQELYQRLREYTELQVKYGRISQEFSANWPLTLTEMVEQSSLELIREFFDRVSIVPHGNCTAIAAAAHCIVRAHARAVDGVAFADDPPSVRPTKYETFCRANGVIVAVIDWRRGERRKEGGKWIVA